MNFKHYLSLVAILFLLPSVIFGQENGLWSDISEPATKNGKRQIVPESYRTVSLNLAALQLKLALSPLESPTAKSSSTLTLAIPMPDGSTENFRVVESPIMEPGLAAKFPEIKTYLAQGIDDPYATMRFDITHKGFHGMIASSKGTVFIDPYNNATTQDYISYFKKDFKTSKNFECLFEDNSAKGKSTDNTAKLNALSNGETLRTYRLACAATGEYTVFHGGTVADGQAAIVTTFNRVNQVYENDLAIRFVLVANNDQLVYTDPNTDPFTNNNAGVLIGESQTEIDATIGDANYDIGHTVSTGGGGLASLGVPCRSGLKARGITGTNNPVGDPFDIDYVAHEVGHQFGGNHTFNGSTGSCNSNISSHSYEPGSGTTIQAYAGICAPQNIQNRSDPYFHIESLNEMITYSTSGAGDACPVKTATGNTPPVSNVPISLGLTIPINTPFELTGAAVDVDGDALTYCWEQYDLGPQGAPETPVGNAPLFRSFLPTADPVRTFPRLTDLLNNTIVYGEILPFYTRSMNFRLTVRDNRAGGGGVHCSAYDVDVDETAGPFEVTAPNTAGLVWPVGSSQTITWNVANTQIAPVSCSNVDILMSTDGGFTYPITLMAGATNDGTQAITVPNNPSTEVRIKVICSDNIFFDLSNQNLEVQVTGADYFLSSSPESDETCKPGDATYTIEVNGFGGFTDDVSLSASGVPAGATASFSPATITGGAGFSTLTLTSTGVAVDDYTVTVSGTSSVDKTVDIGFVVVENPPGTTTLDFPQDGATEVGLSPTFVWNPATEATGYEFDLATDAGFTTIVESGIIQGNPVYAVMNGLTPSTDFYWRVRGFNNCGIGAYSATFQFRTVNIVCMTYNSADIPKAISAVSTDQVTSTITVPDFGQVTDVNVIGLNGTHTYISDLDFNLMSPGGTPLLIIDRLCGTLDDFNLSLDDASATTIPCPMTDGATHQPSNSLAAFNGEEIDGTWTLTINDYFNEDGGSLDGWSLEICYTPQTGCAPYGGFLGK